VEVGRSAIADEEDMLDFDYDVITRPSGASVTLIWRDRREFARTS
jgi:hypothetical protein